MSQPPISLTSRAETLMPLGRHVARGRPMSPGLEALMWKLLRRRGLNTLSSVELRYLHAVLGGLYDLCLNVYLLREALANTGARDDAVLARKVPLEFWAALREGCVAMGVSDAVLCSEHACAALWRHLNARPPLLLGLARYVLARLGLRHLAAISTHNLVDGNFLFNLGGVLPARLLMIISGCLLRWGDPAAEPWLRGHVARLFLLYLVLSGHLLPRRSFMAHASADDHRGPMDIIAADVAAMAGVCVCQECPGTQHGSEGCWDYVFIFNNNYGVPGFDGGDESGSGAPVLAPSSVANPAPVSASAFSAAAATSAWESRWPDSDR
ncbi:UL79 [Eptesicus fuscus gammaherpesvirus]|uniref:UL79 n=1 Tax=vespertilionid gammaherpesvirus 3 TaxID=2846598 RepID=A0A2D0ZNV3_9GAMA|nr:UL79 [Eptesicus fuscus gammaherpesvirus]ATA58247.1 UL79 [Eptesicus fuscus gammaherpesvirus]WAH70917.1 regulatory protein [Eptesicus fuscus gammaherpesvirus]